MVTVSKASAAAAGEAAGEEAAKPARRAVMANFMVYVGVGSERRKDKQGFTGSD